MKREAERSMSERNPWNWILACVLAIASHLLWFFWLDTSWSLPRGNTGFTAPQWTMVPLSGDTATQPLADMLGVWSPATFALPTSLGFSRSLLTEEIRLRPPLQSPSDIAMVLDREQLTRDAEPVVALPEWEYMRVKLDAEPLRVPVPSAVGDDERTLLPPAPRVEYMEGVDARPAEHMLLPEDGHLWGPTPWSAELTLHIDAWGVVTRVVVAQRVPDDSINHELIRAVYRWRWAPADREDTARVRIVYHGAAGFSSRQEEGAR